MVRRIDASTTVRVFFSIYNALKTVQRAKSGGPSLSQIEEAAITAFLLAALALVDATPSPQRTARDHHLVEKVEVCNQLVCALIAAALFPGELGLEARENSEEPWPSHYHEIAIADSDQFDTELHRAVYFALFPSRRETNEITQESLPLTEKQLGRMRVEIQALVDDEGKRLTLVAKGFASGERFEAFSAKHRLPVLLPTEGLASRIRGMERGDLYGQIERLWDLCTQLRGHAPTPLDPHPPSKPAGGPPMVLPTVHFHGPVGAASFGPRSPAMSGESAVAHLGDRAGFDLAQLIPLLQQLQKGIRTDGGVPPERKEMDEQAATALAEAGKGENADPGVIKNALVRIRDVAQITEHGNKIFGVAREAYNGLAAHLGWPTLP
jgi:hypothetical protein